MIAFNSLSRQSDHKEGVELNNSNQILLKPEYFAIHALEHSHDSLVDNEEIL